MSALRLEDGMCPAQGYVETLLWNWEFSLDLFGPKPFIILCWHSVNLQGSVKAPVMWKKFAVSLIETRHLATTRHWRTVCWEVTLLPYQGSFLYGIHLVLSPAVVGLAVVVPLAESILPVSSSLVISQSPCSPFTCLSPHQTVSRNQVLVSVVSPACNTLYSIVTYWWMNAVNSEPI